MRPSSLWIISALVLTFEQAFCAEIRGRVQIQKNGKTLNASQTPVRLHMYRDEFEFMGAERKTDKQGYFRFSDLESGSRYSYILYPIIDGLNYPYRETQLEKPASVQTIDFVLPEATGSIENIRASEAIFFEVGKKDIWKITHDVTVKNEGTQLYHPGMADADVVELPLFTGGFDLAFIDGIPRQNTKIDDQKDTLQLFTTIAPGETAQIRFSYFYLPASRKITYERAALLPRSNVTLFFKKKPSLVSKQFELDPLAGKILTDYPYAYTSGPIAKTETIGFTIRGILLARDYPLLAAIASCLLALVGLIYWATTLFSKAQPHSERSRANAYRYLLDLKTQLDQNKISKSLYLREEQKVVNYLFQIGKKQIDV